MRNENEGTIPKRVKIGPKTLDCMFIGYATNSKACRFMVHKSELSDSQVKSLNDLGKNQRRMYLIKRFRGVVNVNGQITSYEFDLVTFLLENESHLF